MKKKVNKNLLKHRRGQDESGASLRRLFPSVNAIAIDLVYQSPEGFELDSERREFGPEDEVDLSANCPGACGVGEMDLEGKVREMIGARRTEADSRALCREPAGARPCGCELRARLQIEYQDASA